MRLTGLALLLLGQLALGASSALGAEELLAQKGRELRAELDATYRQLGASGSLSNSIKDGNDVTPMVVKYVPVGSSFEDGQAILRAAGCAVRTGRDGHALASIILGGFFDKKHTFAVDLAPRPAGDHSVVDRVSARILLTYVASAGR